MAEIANYLTSAQRVNAYINLESEDALVKPSDAKFQDKSDGELK